MINGTSLSSVNLNKMDFVSEFTWEWASGVEFLRMKIWNVICVSQIIVITWWEIKRQLIWKFVHHVRAFKRFTIDDSVTFYSIVVYSDIIIYYLLVFVVYIFEFVWINSILHQTGRYLDVFYEIISHRCFESMPFNVMFIEIQ